VHLKLTYTCQVLFRTHFTNSTDLSQEYTFRAERTTSSTCEVFIRTTSYLLTYRVTAYSVLHRNKCYFWTACILNWPVKRGSLLLIHWHFGDSQAVWIGLYYGWNRGKTLCSRVTMKSAYIYRISWPHEFIFDLGCNYNLTHIDRIKQCFRA